MEFYIHVTENYQWSCKYVQILGTIFLTVTSTARHISRSVIGSDHCCLQKFSLELAQAEYNSSRMDTSVLYPGASSCNSYPRG